MNINIIIVRKHISAANNYRLINTTTRRGRPGSPLLTDVVYNVRSRKPASDVISVLHTIMDFCERQHDRLLKQSDVCLPFVVRWRKTLVPVSIVIVCCVVICNLLS